MKQKISFHIDVIAEMDLKDQYITISRVLMALKDGEMKIETPDVFEGSPVIICTEKEKL